MQSDANSTRPDWTTKAACQDADPELFFPDSMDDAGAAKRVCATCPVARECLRFALDTEQRWGIWGGSTARQRVRLQKRLAGEEPEPVKSVRPPGGQAAVNALKTHCKNNHEFTDENTSHYRGRRQCITCHLARLERQRERRRLLKESAV